MSKSPMDISTLIIGLTFGLILGVTIMRILFTHEQKEIRKSTLTGSKNQILGELYEKILPALPNFPFKPKDMVFLWKGCDYLIFDGLTEGRLREVIFLELKSGNARLTKNEEAIRSTISQKHVRFAEYHIGSTSRGENK
jgi:predicted Holliday junction resolvase-like endonuclease